MKSTLGLHGEDAPFSTQESGHPQNSENEVAPRQETIDSLPGTLSVLELMKVIPRQGPSTAIFVLYFMGVL